MSVVKEAVESFPFAGRNLLLSCSGGIDSMILLHALVEAGFKPEVVHINYQLRGEDSNADQRLVEEAAQAYGLKCTVHYCPQELIKGKGINLQAAARDFRRQIYSGWIAASPLNIVVLAHHADDQVETFFLQYFRGSGSIGLGGMYEDKSGITRPLLNVSRDKIHQYAISENVRWREDKSNQSLAYARNLFRNRLIPELFKENPSLRESVLTLMDAFRQQRELTEASVEPIVLRWQNENQLEINAWHNFEDDQRLIFLQKSSLPLWLKDRMPELINGDGSQKLEIKGGILIKENEKLIFIGDQQKINWDFKIEEVEILPEAFSKNEIYLDSDGFELEDLLIRNYRTGDRIKSLGMKGSQLVSAVLKEKNIPLRKRKDIPVLTIREEIVWIPGIKIGRSHLADENSGRIVRLTICDTDNL